MSVIQPILSLLLLNRKRIIFLAAREVILKVSFLLAEKSKSIKHKPELLYVDSFHNLFSNLLF